MSNAPLLSHRLPKPEEPPLARLRAYLSEEISTSWSDIMLILHCFVTGLLDSAVFNVWSCFVSMQTGNTIYLGLGASANPPSQPYRWAKSGTSILSFLAGCFVFSRAMRAFGPLRRATIVATSAVQALLIFAAAVLGSTGVVPPGAGDLIPADYIVLLPLALLSFQAGGQIWFSRVFGYGEVTSVVLTSAYCDLAIDDGLFTEGVKKNVKRNRRVSAAVVMLCGAISGGFLTTNGDISLSLWIAGGIKALFAVIWMVWRGEEGGIRLE